MSRSTLSLLTILLVAVLTGRNSAHASLFSAVPKCLKCPDDPSLPIGCLKNIIPPWPICLFHDVDYFRRVALDGATRCCDGEDAAADMSECRCPKKDTAKFVDSIGDWCKGVASCPTDAKGGSEVDATIASE
mmetsp:Transcript_34557/g.101559  ORF Transcript_34557/g.101559 Transcript_34557/m.101559 type:complete len:132 (+) Transcript_34557:157-552(+)